MSEQEQQILNTIYDLDDENNFEAIVHYIKQIPKQQLSTNILVELAQAYNNIYWQNRCEENKIYLYDSLKLLSELKMNMPQALWHYLTGYAYYYLEQLKESKYHLQIAGEEGNSKELLRQIEWVERHKISVLEADEQYIRYLLKDMLQFMQNEMPDVYYDLNPAKTEAELNEFAEKRQLILPEKFKHLHRSFSGQKSKNLLKPYLYFDFFVSLDEIETVQTAWQALLHSYFGNNWQSLILDDEICPSKKWVKKQLFNHKWLPVLATGHQFLCIDLDPVRPQDYGQTIFISIQPLLEDCQVYYDNSCLKECFDVLFYQILYGSENSYVDTKNFYISTDYIS